MKEEVTGKRGNNVAPGERSLSKAASPFCRRMVKWHSLNLIPQVPGDLGTADLLEAPRSQFLTDTPSETAVRSEDLRSKALREGRTWKHTEELGRGPQRARQVLAMQK